LRLLVWRVSRVMRMKGDRRRLNGRPRRCATLAEGDHSRGIKANKEVRRRAWAEDDASERRPRGFL